MPVAPQTRVHVSPRRQPRPHRPRRLLRLPSYQPDASTVVAGRGAAALCCCHVRAPSGHHPRRRDACGMAAQRQHSSSTTAARSCMPKGWPSGSLSGGGGGGVGWSSPGAASMHSKQPYEKPPLTVRSHPWSQVDLTTWQALVAPSRGRSKPPVITGAPQLHGPRPPHYHNPGIQAGAPGWGPPPTVL